MLDNNLVFSLIFDNEQIFKNLSKKECKNILLTFSQELIKTNTNIVNIIIIYNCKNIFKLLQKNIKNYVKAKHKHNLIKQELYGKKESYLVKYALTCKYKDDLKKFLLSEYKESIHDCIGSPHFKDIDIIIINEFGRIIHDMYALDDIYNYKHNPKYFLFENKLYMYYELLESKGINIMDPLDVYIGSMY